MKKRLVALREMAAALVAEAKKLLDGVPAGESASAEVTQKVQALYDEASKLGLEIKELESQIALKEGVNQMDAFYNQPAGAAPPMASPGGQRMVGKSIGQRFVESEQFQALAPFAKSKSRIPGLPVPIPDMYKTLITGASATSGGAFVVDERTPIYVDLRQRQLVLRDLVAPGTTGSDLVEFVRQTLFTNAAAPVAEATATSTGGTKPESAMAWVVVQEAVKTIAHWIPATRRALADAGQIRSLVDSHLRVGLDLVLEDQMVNGDGTGENFTGILNTVGILVQPMGGDTQLDALKRAMTRVALSAADGGGGVPATAHLMNPLDLDEILLAKDTTGQYIIGDPAMRQGGGQVYLWGIPVAQSTVLAQGSALTASWLLATMLWDREEATITASDSHSDFFVRNLVAILAEMRAAFGVLRPAGVCQVTFT